MNDSYADGFVEAQRQNARFLRDLAADWDPDHDATNTRAELYADLIIIPTLAGQLRDRPRMTAKDREYLDIIVQNCNDALEKVRKL